MWRSFVRILHTSDFHLAEHKPETLSSLEEVLKVAKEQSIDILTIAGDLFDSNEDAEALRALLRQKFSTNNFEIIVIPGNHDSEVYKGNLDFGSNLKVATKEPYELFGKDKTTIVALPFTSTLDEGILSKLAKESNREETTILLIHCTLDIGFSVSDFGEEAAYRYCPVSKATLSRLGFDYILAGHFHRTTTILQLGEKGVFVYPGSPVSHSLKEVGKRQVILVDTQKKDWRSIPLQSFYYDTYHVTATPGREDSAIGNIQKWVDERCSDKCSLKVIVDGFIEKDEHLFKHDLEKVADRPYIKIEHLYRNVKEVFEHPLYVRFKEKLIKKNLEHEKQIDAIVVDAMARLLKSRELGA